VRSRRTSCTRSSSSRFKGTRCGAGSATATCGSWRTSGARSSSSGSLTWRFTWRSAPAQELALQISASAANTNARRMKLQDNVRAVVVKEVQLRDPVLTGALHRCRCSRASPSTSNPAFNFPLPCLRRPPADLNAATTDKDCDLSGAPLVGQRTTGPGPGLVARVLWLYCMRLASSGVGCVRGVRLAFGRHPMHPPHT